MTELNEPLRVAKRTPDHAGFFFDAFLSTQVFIPALSAEKKPGEWKRLKNTERFFPLYLKNGEMRAIPAFDELEKLKTWADDKAFNYLVLHAFLLLKVIAPEISLVLNEGT